jgi:hypothetical protein
MDLKRVLETYLFNGMGLQTAVAVQVFEVLTLQHTLHFLTLLTWNEVFSFRLLLHKTKAWCPACLEEWRTNNQVIYDLLLWNFNVVTFCSRHHCKLSTQCPQNGCQRKIPWLAWYSLPGHCPFCHQWLGGSAPALVEMNEEAVHWQEWVIEQLGILLALAPELESTPSRTRIHEVLQHFCQQMSQGNIYAFARKLGIHDITVFSWFERGCIPQLQSLLTLCALCGVSLKACFFDEITMLRYLPGSQVPKIERAIMHRKAPENANTPYIRHTLQMILASDEEPPPSLNEVARRLKISTRYLRKYHLDLCKAISDRYWNFIQSYKQTRDQQYINEVCQLAHQLVAQGKRPSEKAMSKVLSKPGILRSPLIREVWKSVLKEYDSQK